MDDELKKMLTEHLRYERAMLGLLSEIKYELQNSRVLREQKEGKSYTIVYKDPNYKPGWIRGWIDKWL